MGALLPLLCGGRSMSAPNDGHCLPENQLDGIARSIYGHLGSPPKKVVGMVALVSETGDLAQLVVKTCECGWIVFHKPGDTPSCYQCELNKRFNGLAEPLFPNRPRSPWEPKGQ